MVISRNGYGSRNRPTSWGGFCLPLYFKNPSKSMKILKYISFIPASFVVIAALMMLLLTGVDLFMVLPGWIIILVGLMVLLGFAFLSSWLMEKLWLLSPNPTFSLISFNALLLLTTVNLILNIWTSEDYPIQGNIFIAALILILSVVLFNISRGLFKSEKTNSIDPLDFSGARAMSSLEEYKAEDIEGIRKDLRVMTGRNLDNLNDEDILELFEFSKGEIKRARELAERAMRNDDQDPILDDKGGPITF